MAANLLNVSQDTPQSMRSQNRACPAADSIKPRTRASTDAKVLRKREIDRRSQQKLRQRQKARIHELETLLENFQRCETNDSVATLTKKLEKSEAERKRLDSTLRSLEAIIGIHRSASTSEGLAQPECDATFVGESGVVTFPFTADSVAGNRPSMRESGSTLSPANDPSTPLITLYHSSLHSKNPQPASPSLKTYTQLDLTSTSITDGCSCCTAPSHRPLNLWRFANDLLIQSFRFRGWIDFSDTKDDEHIPIQAMVEGWEAVAENGRLSLLWQILRRIDESLFISCGKTERLAMLHVMHLLLQFHNSPTTETHVQLPPWYSNTPSQNLAHSYAINFLAWPGLRERLILAEHRYCGNIFWNLLCLSFRIRWSSDFTDTYTINPETGHYKMSAQFSTRISDIHNWAMGPEIFTAFPEFYSDLPALEHNPPPISNRVQLQLANFSMPAKEIAKKPVEKLAKSAGVAEQPYDQDALLMSELDFGHGIGMNMLFPGRETISPGHFDNIFASTL